MLLIGSSQVQQWIAEESLTPVLPRPNDHNFNIRIFFCPFKEKSRGPAAQVLCSWKGRLKSIFLISSSEYPHRAVLQHRAHCLGNNLV